MRSEQDDIEKLEMRWEAAIILQLKTQRES